ncbi:MAG: T9SS type A sorting domain-containing protein [Lentimicrobium sp.]|nr:T9SS type A sorting domain-containing protein [Lentimicrobium sp.]
MKGEESVQLDVSNYKSGIYLIRYLTINGGCFVQKFIVAG